jgi:hypothetical protein
MEEVEERKTKMTTIFNGKTYTVEATGNEHYPFHLNGPRGAQYSLFQLIEQPEYYMVINASRMQVLRGYFQIVDGQPVQVI